MAAEEKKSKTGLYLMIGVVIMAVIGFVAYFALSGNKSASPGSGGGVTSTTTKTGLGNLDLTGILGSFLGKKQTGTAPAAQGQNPAISNTDAVNAAILASIY